MTRLLMAGLTDSGKQRDNNEDAFAILPEIGLAILADGMGGHQAGEVASAMAIDIIQRSITARLAAGLRPKRTSTSAPTAETEVVREAIELANHAVVEAASTNPAYAGMGSTVVVALFHGDRICVAHLGDSRLYRFREGKLTPLTEDHSMVQELVRRGFLSREEARLSDQKNIITRALGVEAAARPDVREDKIQEGDLYLLCSDGLHDMMGDESIEALLRVGGELPDLTRRLVAEANVRGGADNITVVLARTGKRFTRDKKAAQKLQGFEV